MHSSSRPNRSAIPGPSLMTKEQMGEYLRDLRSNCPQRPQRPAGSRPCPTYSSRRSLVREKASEASLSRPSNSSSEFDKNQPQSRSSSSSSHRPSLNISVSTRSSVDNSSASTYLERLEREKEHTEAKQIRSDIEQVDFDLERRVIAGAKQEAEELIQKHQESVTKQPNETQLNVTAMRNNLVVRKDGKYKEKQTDAESSSNCLNLDAMVDALPTIKKQSSYSRLANYWNNSGLGNRRRSSGSRTSLSGKQKTIFVNPDDKIYEDPVERAQPALQQEVRIADPSYFRRNPFDRARSTKEILSGPIVVPQSEFKVPYIPAAKKEPADCRTSEDDSLTWVDKKFDASAADEDLLQDEDVRYKDGLEVRSEDIRAATSMRRKDRSPKLPSPTAISDSPSRPIVSFSPDWTPPNSRKTNKEFHPGTPYPSPRKSQNHSISEPEGSGSASRPDVTIVQEEEPPSIQINDDDASSIMSIPEHPKSDYQVPPIPVAPPRSPSRGSISQAPSIIIEESAPVVADEKSTSHAAAEHRPQHRYSAFPKSRVLPTSSSSGRLSSKPSWTGSMRRNAALCAQCALPISGKTVTAAGLRFHPSCFTCHHCGEGLECVDFYPEPTQRRAGRIERIERRMKGENFEEQPGETAAEDGDDSLRFYCHLDFHEFFSPRCKSCKTPIEGEVVVACGAEWHVGHFFCAECGDPFDPTTPFVEKEGYAWCIECHTNRYSAKCKKCRRPVTNMVVQALGGDWHNECFCCTICNSSFEDGRFFLRPFSQDPICVTCEDKRLKALMG